jgi:hypothetical protein
MDHREFPIRCSGRFCSFSAEHDHAYLVCPKTGNVAIVEWPSARILQEYSIAEGTTLPLSIEYIQSQVPPHYCEVCEAYEIGDACECPQADLSALREGADPTGMIDAIRAQLALEFGDHPGEEFFSEDYRDGELPDNALLRLYLQEKKAQGVEAGPFKIIRILVNG